MLVEAGYKDIVESLCLIRSLFDMQSVSIQYIHSIFFLSLESSRHCVHMGRILSAVEKESERMILLCWERWVLCLHISGDIFEHAEIKSTQGTWPP